MLTIMSNRINKQRKTSSEQSLARKIHLLRSLSLDLSEISSYNHYIRLGFSIYEVSLLDSSYCIEYVRKNRSGCNILSVLSKQLLAISIQYLHVEAELEEVKERVVCLQKQKKMQREKLTRTISHSIFDIDELERMETEETARFKESEVRIQQIYSFLNTDKLLILIIDWLFILPISPFSLRLFADLGILNTVETFPNIQSDS